METLTRHVASGLRGMTGRKMPLLLVSALGSPLTPCGSLMSWLELRTSPSSYATDCSFCPRRISPGAVHFVIAKMRIVIIGIRIIKIQYTHFYFALAGLFQYLLIKWAATAAHKSVLNWQL